MIFDIVFIVVIILVGGILLFPVKVRFLFCGSRNEGKLEVHLFRKKIFSTEEKKMDAGNAIFVDGKLSAKYVETDEEMASKEDDFDAENPWQKKSSEIKTKKEEFVDAKASVETKEFKRSPAQSATNKLKTQAVSVTKTENKKTKRKAGTSDLEFLTLVAEPHFDRKLLKHSLYIGKAFFRIFHCYFEKTVVDGIRWGEDYAWMGNLMGGLNFMSGTIPLFNNWEFLVDWQGGKLLQIRGGFVAQFSIARILGFLLISFGAAAQMIALFFLNRHKYRKNPESIRLVFWRRFIVRFLASK